MPTQRIDFEQLSQLSGYHDRESVVEWLRAERISFAYDANRQPWTTVSAIERCMRRQAESGRYPYADIALEL